MRRIRLMFAAFTPIYIMHSAVTGPTPGCVIISRALGRFFRLRGQLLHLRFHLSVHRLQRTPSIRGVGRQWQARDFRFPVAGSRC